MERRKDDCFGGWALTASSMVCDRSGHFGRSPGAGGHMSFWSPAGTRERGKKIAGRSNLERNLEESLA